jgi:hypothetical protein
VLFDKAIWTAEGDGFSAVTSFKEESPGDGGVDDDEANETGVLQFVPAERRRRAVGGHRLSETSA